MPLVLDYEANGENYLITSSAFKSSKDEYIEKESYKAFAQSSSGSWGWKAGIYSAERAVELVLEGCKKHNKRFKRSKPYKIINIDGVWAAGF